MNGKQPFHEDYVNPKADPLHPKQTADFDYSAVEEALGEFQPVEADDEKSVVLIRRIFAWCTNVNLRKSENVQLLIGRRFIALAWVLNPGLFEGTPSAGRLAELIGIRSAPRFFALTGEASRHFGIRNRAQAHAANWKKENNHVIR
jgi:hypothetical protein